MVTHHNQPAFVITRFLQEERETLELGASLARVVQPGMVIHLCGDLGAGKTTLARGILSGCGVTGKIKSPTYTLVEPYTTSRLYFYHFDFYRLRQPDEWLEAGFREYFNHDSVCLVEWPEKAGPQLPQPDLRIELALAGDGRNVALRAETEAGRQCLSELQI